MPQYTTNLFNGEAVGPRTPMPVDSVEAQEIVPQTETLTYTVTKDAAGAFIEFATKFSPIYNHLGDRVGSFWGMKDNLVHTAQVDALTETAGSADFVVTDLNNNLENLFETTEGATLVKRYVAKITDKSGGVLYAWVGGVAVSSNVYTFTVYDGRVDETGQNWVGTLGDFDVDKGAKVEFYTYQSSLAFVTGTTLTEEVLIPQEYKRGWFALFTGRAYNVNKAAQSLSNGQFFVDYYRGLIIGKKADGTNSETITYNIAASTITGVAGSSSSEVSGDVAHDAVDSGNPVKIGGIARSAQATAVAALDRVQAVFNLFGELVIAGYTWATNSIRTEEIDPVDEHYVEEELVDTTNVGAATTYYPSSTGRVMGNFNNVSIHGVTSGGVTVTVEAKTDDSTDWVDITPAGYRLDDNTTGNTNFVDQTFLLDFDDLHTRNIRIKSVTADGTNGVQYHWKLTAV